MAITAETRADIISLVVGMFDAAPSTNLLNDFVRATEIGQSLEVTASGLAESAEFKSIYAEWLTNEEFAAKFVSNILVEASADTVAEAEAFVTGQLNAGADRGEVILSAVQALSAVSADDANWGASAQALSNKVAVATYYSVDMGGNANDLASLQAVLQNVDQNSDVSSSTSIVELINGAEAPSDNAPIELSSGTDRLTGTSESDSFEAFMAQNSMAGGVSNTLSSADKLDGQNGYDYLHAQLTKEFVGINNGWNDIDVQPRTEEIEEITIESRDYAPDLGFNGSGAVVTVDAKYMTDVVKIGSKQSDGDLVIENLTTLTKTGNLADARNTEDLTIIMDHTDNVNSDGDASDLTVYFDEDYLISGKIGASSSIDYRVMNQDAYDLIQEGKQDVELLDGVTFERLNFELDGETYQLAPLIGSDEDATGTAIRTHEQLVEAMNAAIEQLGLSDKVTAVIGGEFTEETAQGATGSSRTAPIVRLEGVEGVELTANENLVYLAPSDQNPTSTDGTLVQNSNRYDRAEVSSTEEQNKPVTINVELEKVGRDGEGGNLVIGGKDQNSLTDTETDQVDGIAVFNIDVNGTNDQPSNLGYVSSTDQALNTVNIADGATWDGADLVIRDAFNGGSDNENWSNNTNVETVNASGFSGDLTIGSSTAMMNVDTFTATGGGAINVTASIDGTEKGDFNYTTGVAGDTVVVALDGDAVDQDGTSFTVNTGASGDKVTVIMDTVDLDNVPDVSFQTMQALDNLTINAGSGDDDVNLNAYGTFDINAGDGSDFVRINSTDQNGDASTGMWTFGQDTGAQVFGERVLYNATLEVSFAGFEQTVNIPTDANGNYIANQLTINEAIKSAIAANPELARLLKVENDAETATTAGVGGTSSDTSSTGVQELVITSTVGGLNDLSVKISQPVLTTNDLASADVTALRQGIIDTTDITSTSLGDSAAIVAQMGQAEFGNGAKGVFAGNVGVNGVVGSDYTAINTGNITATTDDATAINFSTINMGTGSNDLVVLHSNDNSANVLEVTGTFGKVSVVNFFDNTDSDVAGSGALTVGNHLLDFTSILDNRVDVSTGNSNTQSTVAIANTVNTDATAEANSVSVLNFTADAANANAVDWAGLNATNLVAALNGNAGAAILGTGTIQNSSLDAATTTAGGDLIGSTHKHVVMVQNVNNPGEYKVFSLTSASDSANFNDDGVLLGTLDFGYSIGTGFNLAGNAVSTDGQFANSVMADLEMKADQLLNGELKASDGVTNINEFNVDITDGMNAVTPTYTLASDASAVNEGSSVTFTLNAQNATDGDYAYTISGVEAADTATALTGNITVANGVGTLVVDLTADNATEGAETLALTVAGQTATVTVNDTSVTGGVNVLTPDASGNVTATSGSDVIQLSGDQLDDGNYVIDGFDTAADKLSLAGLTGADGVTLSDLAGDTIDTGVIGVQVDQINQSIFVNLGQDANGDVISVELNGVTDPSLVDITLA
ncbi:beta strand repeat-containing protein [Oceanospirillum sediminis]|uniref:Uncharacterized protein n=1 Tax=Oceanospirillum sediminis TaxID=2760088 RepID=A0A839IUQ7_9GAMM|nr:hypothetical protein [Oceanospirillum sediminis]MBB1488209.1 hypothetical protein [Oceanospirillum sediminis]